MTGFQLELVEQFIPTGAGAHIAFHSTSAQDETERLVQRLDEGVRPVELLKAECRPVSGGHAGPRTVGVAFYTE